MTKYKSLKRKMEDEVKNYGLSQYYGIYINLINEINVLSLAKGLKGREAMVLEYYPSNKDLIENVIAINQELIEEKEKLDGPIVLKTKKDVVILVDEEEYTLEQTEIKCDNIEDAKKKGDKFLQQVEEKYGSFIVVSSDGYALKNEWDILIECFYFVMN